MHREIKRKNREFNLIQSTSGVDNIKEKGEIFLVICVFYIKSPSLRLRSFIIRVLGYYLFQMTPLIGNMSVEDQMALLLLTVKHEVSMRYPTTMTYRKSFLRKLLNKVHVMTGKIIQMFLFSLVISQNVSSFCSLFSIRKLWEGNM